MSINRIPMSWKRFDIWLFSNSGIRRPCITKPTMSSTFCGHGKTYNEFEYGSKMEIKIYNAASAEEICEVSVTVDEWRALYDMQKLFASDNPFTHPDKPPNMTSAGPPKSYFVACRACMISSRISAPKNASSPCAQTRQYRKLC